MEFVLNEFIYEDFLRMSWLMTVLNDNDPEIINLISLHNDCAIPFGNILTYDSRNMTQEFIQDLSKMNPLKDFQETNFDAFNIFNDQDQDMREPVLNCLKDLSSNDFNIPSVLEENLKRYFFDTK